MSGTITDKEIGDILDRSRRVAVLGLRDTPAQAGYYVPEYLEKQGYEIFGVNPKLAGRTFFGHTVVAALADLTEPPDLIDVFRRAEHLAAHLPEILAMPTPPPVVWLQLGIRDDDFAAKLTAFGITVVQDRCALAEHRRLRIAAK